MHFSLSVNVLPGKSEKCGPPPDIENGDILSFPMPEYSQGETLKYKCPNLYILEGSQQITCINGQWTNPPVCLGRLKHVLHGQELCDCSHWLFRRSWRCFQCASFAKQHLCCGWQQRVFLLSRRNFFCMSACTVPSAVRGLSPPPLTWRSGRRGVWLNCLREEISIGVLGSCVEDAAAVRRLQWGGWVCLNALNPGVTWPWEN